MNYVFVQLKNYDEAWVKKYKKISTFTERFEKYLSNHSFNANNVDGIIRNVFNSVTSDDDPTYGTSENQRINRDSHICVGQYNNIKRSAIKATLKFIEEHAGADENATHFKCSDCGIYHLIEDRVYLDSGDRYICRNCRENYIECSCCGDPTHDGNIYDVNSIGYLCETCMNERDDIYTCPTCGRRGIADRMIYCNGCELYYCRSHACNCNNNSVIKNYGFKPKPKFHGTHNRYLGMELEIDGLSDRYKFAQDLSEEIPYEFLYMKTDGSLSDNGVEIVTHPCTYEFFRDSFDIKKIIEIARLNGGLSHDSGNCGLHFHVSKNYFSNYELSATKILYMFEKFWDQFAVLSRRKEFRYCNKNNKPRLNKEYVKNVKRESTREGRYVAVNLANDNTIEFRLWRGSLKFSTIMATIELTDFICVVAENVSIMTLQKMSWDDMKKLMEEYKYKQLVKYCIERQI